MTAVTQFKVEDFTERVREKIRAEFISLLPPDAFHQLVKDTLARFTQSRTEYGQVRPSDFERIVLDEYEKALRAKVREVLGGSEWAIKFDQFGQQIASDAVTRIVTEHASTMIAGVVGGLVQDVVQAMKNRIPS